ncbi:MAG: TonB-dependent receptor, partial [Alphaproteobacteria bacterium]
MSVSAEEASYYEGNLEAYEEDEAADEASEVVMESIIVTGSRSKNRSVAESLAPIDVLSGSEIGNTTSDELVDSLAQLIPSFNVKREAMNDGAAFVRPARLRNLSPDQTLVMVNGKRRHRSAFIAGDSAAQAPDMAVIPSFAVKRVEVLRDGASAQYGSDAIAGVVNIILDTEAG